MKILRILLFKIIFEGSRDYYIDGGKRQGHKRCYGDAGMSSVRTRQGRQGKQNAAQQQKQQH